MEDDLSGVAGVQVNSMLFTTLTNGALHVELDENMNRFEKLAVRAFDYAGNFSEPVSLDNPHYTPPADPTPMPTATPEPTAKPTGEKGTASPVPTATPVSSANRYNGLGSSLIYVQDDPSPTPEPTAAPTPETIVEYITIGPGMPYQADGNSHTLDMLYSAATNKQFITLQKMCIRDRPRRFSRSRRSCGRMKPKRRLFLNRIFQRPGLRDRKSVV